jgi:hypothetical protein
MLFKHCLADSAVSKQQPLRYSVMLMLLLTSYTFAGRFRLSMQQAGLTHERDHVAVMIAQLPAPPRDPWLKPTKAVKLVLLKVFER